MSCFFRGGGVKIHTPPPPPRAGDPLGGSWAALGPSLVALGWLLAGPSGSRVVPGWPWPRPLVRPLLVYRLETDLCIKCTKLGDVGRGEFETSGIEQLLLDRLFDCPFDAVKFCSRPGGFAASVFELTRGAQDLVFPV